MNDSGVSEADDISYYLVLKSILKSLSIFIGFFAGKSRGKLDLQMSHLMCTVMSISDEPNKIYSDFFFVN